MYKMFLHIFFVQKRKWMFFSVFANAQSCCLCANPSVAFPLPCPPRGVCQYSYRMTIYFTVEYRCAKPTAEIF